MSDLRSEIRANRLLASLPGSTLTLIEPHLEPIALAAGDVVHDVGPEIGRVYFPISGIASLQVVFQNGRAVDTAMISRDGALGTSAVHDACQSGVVDRSNHDRGIGDTCR